MSKDVRKFVGGPAAGRVMAAVSVCLCGVLLAAEPQSRPHENGGPAVGKPKISTFKELSDFVAKHLATRRGYKPGSLISKGDVAPIVAGLKADGWNEDGLDRVYRAVLDDKHFLVREMRSDQGRKFMDEIAKQKGAFDRLDRVSQAKGGERAIMNTMSLPGAAGFWNPNAKPGFANTAQMLPKQGGRRRRAAEFSEPTGKIYTGAQLIKHLAPLCPKKPQKSGRADGTKGTDRT